MKSSIVPDYKPAKSDLIVHYEIKASSELPFHEGLFQLLQHSALNFSYQGQEHTPKIFDLNQESKQCKIAFDIKLFEPGNISQNLSVFAGSIFDTHTVEYIRILDVKWPSHLQAAFPGPSNDLEYYWEKLNTKNRPLSSVIIYPKAELNIKECLEKAYHIWMGGCDIVQDSEILTALNNNDFQERISFLAKEAQSCTERSGNIKIYIPNISAANLQEIEFRAKKAKEKGLDIVCINTIHIGFLGIASIKNICQDLGIQILANQIGHSLYTDNSRYQISHPVLALIYRYLGIDWCEIDSNANENNLETAQVLRDKYHRHSESHNPTIPVCTNISHYENIESIIKYFGHELVIQGSSFVYNHPDGIKAGAEAFQYAIEVASQGIAQESAALKNDNFKKALTM